MESNLTNDLLEQIGILMTKQMDDFKVEVVNKMDDFKVEVVNMISEPTITKPNPTYNNNPNTTSTPISK